MKNDYLLPGIAAIFLAIIFPTVVVFEALNFGDGDWKGALIGISDWGFSEVMMIVIGLLCVFVVFNFKKILNEQLNFKSIDTPLLILIGISIVFHILLVIFEGFVSFAGQGANETMESIVTGVTFACLIAFGVIDIVIGIILLTKGNELPSILKVLAVISIIQGIFELSVILFFLVILTFPIYMIILAIYFLRKPETIEVV